MWVRANSVHVRNRGLDVSGALLFHSRSEREAALLADVTRRDNGGSHVRSAIPNSPKAFSKCQGKRLVQSSLNGHEKCGLNALAELVTFERHSRNAT